MFIYIQRCLRQVPVMSLSIVSNVIIVPDLINNVTRYIIDT